MRLLSGRTRRPPEIGTASLADIAFLLMIFFLVATTFDVDTGLRVTLLPEIESCPPIYAKERNVLRIAINVQGAVLVEQTPRPVSYVRREVVRHVTNEGRHPAYAKAPRNAVVSIKTDTRTLYRAYIDVLDEVLLGYRHIWNAEACRLGYADYAAYTAALTKGQKDEIRARFPMNLALAESGWW